MTDPQTHSYHKDLLNVGSVTVVLGIILVTAQAHMLPPSPTRNFSSPRESIYALPLLNSILKNRPYYGFGGPNAIIGVYMDPLGPIP